MNSVIRQRYLKLGIIKPQKGEDVMAKKNSHGTGSAKNATFHNPYHFVPVAKPDNKWHEIGVTKETKARRKEFTSRLPRHCRHDLYVDKTNGEKVYHGRICCKLRTVSPIFIGARRIKDGTAYEPACIAPFELDDRPAIPASSLRGLISSVAEAASNSALRVLEKKYLSVRKSPEEPLKYIGMVVKTGDDYKVFPLKKDAVFSMDRDRKGKPLETYSEKNRQFYYADVSQLRRYRGGKAPLVREQDATPEQKELWKKGIVRRFPVRFGKKRIKNIFMLFDGIKEDKLIPLQPGVEDIFLGLANDRAQATKKQKEIMPRIPEGAMRNDNPEEDKVTVTLKTGDLVFYNKDKEKGYVTEIAFSQIWRKYCGGTVHDFFSKIDKELLPFNPERTKLSPAELIFGFVEAWDTGKADTKNVEALAYKGRVRFSHALLENNDDFPYDEEVILKILDSPKPPCPCLYFEEKGNPNKFIAKTALECDGNYLPKGRKFYLHHKQELETREYKNEKLPSWQTHPELAKPGEKDSRLKQKARITPIKQGKTFSFHVDFENLTSWELGLLCYALKPNESFKHKIGMGKPIGLGTVEIIPEKIEFIDRAERYRTQDIFNDGRYKPGKDNPKIFDELANDFSSQADGDILAAIELLGDLTAIKYRVHTPLRKWQRDEKEEIKTYEWFVENEKTSKHQLKSLKEEKEIPPLKRN